MKQIVTLRLEVKGKLVEWSPKEVDEEDRWNAIVKVVTSRKLEGIPMSEWWKKTKVVKAAKPNTRHLRAGSSR